MQISKTDDFAKIKHILDIQAVITQATGLKMGKHHLKECPFCKGHDCFSIQKEKQSFKCFQCDAQGDVFTFLEKYHTLEKREALERAANLAGIELTPLKNKVPKRPEPSPREKIFFEAARYYHGRMLENGGRKYLTETRGHSMESLKNLGVGWSDGELVNHLRSIGFDEKAILDSGLARIRKTNGDDHLADFFPENFAIFPHWDRERVLHFTKKDPTKKTASYQLPQKNRAGEWRFYNQGALRKFNEIILVEGENDLLSVVDAGMANVIATIGQVSDAQIKTLQTSIGKTFILWFDNDENPEKLFAKGKGYTRKIANAIESRGGSVKVITYPEAFKDPDEYLQAFKGDKQVEIKRLIQEAPDYISWEIQQAGKLEGLSQRSERLKAVKLFNRISDTTGIRKQVYIESLQDLGFSKDAIDQELSASQELFQRIKSYIQHTDKKQQDPNFMAGLIYGDLSLHGRFFHDQDSTVHLILKNRRYIIGNNRPFNALMKNKTGLLPTREPGRSIWESLASEGYNSGLQIDFSRWISVDPTKMTIFINLNSPDNTILRINENEIRKVQNGVNEDNILLNNSRMQPVEYISDADIQKGMTALKELVFDNFTCEREQRYLIICWLISAFFLYFFESHPHLKFSGDSGSGKTTAARLLSMLLYDEAKVENISTAAAWSLANENPLLVFDNLETQDVKQGKENFLLQMATGGGKIKRKAGTDSGISEENGKALICITAIEPLTKSELVNRVLDIDFYNKFKSDLFIESATTVKLSGQRNLILSAILKFIQRDLLPNFDKRMECYATLKSEYADHAKNRMDDYLSLLFLILKQILPYIPYYQSDDLLAGVESGDREVFQAWIRGQNEKAEDTSLGTNNILKILNGLVREYIAKIRSEISAPNQAGHPPGKKRPSFGRMRSGQEYPAYEKFYEYTHPEYLLNVIKTLSITDKWQENGEDISENVCHIEFLATRNELAYAFDRYCKNNGLRNPYPNSAQLGTRLANDMTLLKRDGWTVKDNFKKIHGDRYWLFRKKLTDFSPLKDRKTT
jgi:DNA primase